MPHDKQTRKKTDIKFKEAIVYAWVECAWELIGGVQLDSSYDNYDTAYGWTAENYAQARGGTGINYYTLGIGVFSLNTKKDTDIAIRLNRAVSIGQSYDDATTLDDVIRKTRCSPILHGVADTVVLHKSGEELLDIGKYGIFNTLEGEKLHASPNEKDNMLEYNGTEIFFIEEHSPYWGKGIQYYDNGRFKPSIFKVNLESGLKSKHKIFKSEEVPKEGRIAEIIDRNLYGLWNRHWEQFNFKLDGNMYTVVNNRRTHGDWTTRVIDNNRNEVLKYHSFGRYIVDAISFPEDIILEKFPALKK